MAKAEEYPVLIMPLTAEDGGGYLAIVPDLPGCMSDGATREEALANGQQAILEWIDAASEAGQLVPAPYSAQERALKQKADLEGKVREQAKSLAALDAEIRALRADLDAFGASWPLISFVKTSNLKEAPEEVVH